MNYKHILLKKNKLWVWTALDKDYSEILEFVVGDRSAETFKKLWKKVKHWNCYFWITDGYKVYPKFILYGDQIISKISMTRVEGENSRLRHYLASRHSPAFERQERTRLDYIVKLFVIQSRKRCYFYQLSF
jgi:insertion element IS1 protein InsB